MRALFTSLAVLSALTVAGCASAPAPTRPAPSVELSPIAVFLEISRASSIRSLFEAPADDTETIEELLSEAEDDQREELVWNLVRARLASLEEAYGSRSELADAVREAIQARTREVAAIRERHAQADQRARAEADAAERERERRSVEADQSVRDDEDARERERLRLIAEARQQLIDEANEERRARDAEDDALRRRASGGAESSESDRERAREAADAEFRRRAAEANERRRRRKAAGYLKGSADRAGQPRAKQTRRQLRRRRAAARRARRAAMRERRGGSAARGQPRRASRREGRARRRERRRRRAGRDDAWGDEEGDSEAAYGYLEGEDREELEPFVQRERDARQQLRYADATIEDEQEGLEDIAERYAREQISEELRARIEFALLWAAWRTGQDHAGELASEFTEEHPSAGDLLALAWMIRGEVAADERRVDESLAAFRFGMNRLGEPIYAYSLWRSASVQRDSGNEDGARESLLGVEQEGCSTNPPELVRRLAYAAASTLGHYVRVDADGVTRPEVCRQPGEREEGSEWRPEE